ncbi:MAG: hypothetical protein COA40_08505 [Aequorivita sp.]|nr:MAG: hypothetical protein COA40_08505 [Aequorivita sp.]
MKLNLFRLLLLASMVLFIACLGDDVDIDNNRRILVKGKIVDKEGNPLPDIIIVTSANSDPLGQTQSDASGNFRLISLDEEFDPLDVLINIDPFFYLNVDYDYSSLAYRSSVHNDRLLYDLGTIILGDKAELNLTFNNLLGDENTLGYTIKYTPANCELPLNVTNPPDNCDLAAIREGDLNPISENTTVSIESILGSTVLLEYSLNFEPVQTIEIPLTNLDTNYVFEY